MFQLHDKTRRRICLAGFFMFCVAPTLGAAIWCAMRHLPWTAQEEAKCLGRQLITYLKLSKMPVGLLINFNVPLLKDGIVRRVN